MGIFILLNMKRNQFVDHTGENYISNEGCRFIVIECLGTGKNTIQFENGYIKKNVSYKSISTGSVKNRYKGTTYNFGYIGEGIHESSIDGKDTKKYKTWTGIIQRVKSDLTHSRQPTYKGISVCKEWECFQNFGDWYDDNFKDYMDKWHLDKDILVRGNRHYSPSTCCLVPVAINSLFTFKKPKREGQFLGITPRGKRFKVKCSMWGVRVYLGTFDTIEEAKIVYKKAKEKYIKEVADEWKPLIAPEVYQAMYNYTVDYENI